MRSRPQASSAFDGIHDAQAGNVGEYGFAALAVINGAAVKIAADGDANHDGGLKTRCSSASA